MNNLNDLLSVQQFTEQSISAVLVNLFLCMILVSFIGWFYKKFSRSLGGKTHVGAISLEIAEKLLQSELSSDGKQKALIEKFVDNINMN